MFRIGSLGGFWLYFFWGLLWLFDHGAIATRNESFVERSSATDQFLVISGRFGQDRLAQFIPLLGSLLEK